jgi:DNA-binding protein H-NS
MAQRAEIDRQIAASKAAIFEGTVAEIVCSAEAASVPLDELAAALLARCNKRSVKAKKTVRNPVPAKYTQIGGPATWSGRGVKPQWFKAGDYRVL